MKTILSLTKLILTLSALQMICVSECRSQVRRNPSDRRAASVKDPLIGKTAVVMDELLSPLRQEPSLYAPAVHRMQRGRTVTILASAEADGVPFLKVRASGGAEGWVQSQAVISAARSGDEERGARIVQALTGFEQLEAAEQYFKIFPNSKFKPMLLLLVGDALEDLAAKLSRDAGNRLKRNEMAASAAPLHSYYLNFVMLDRYRRLGVKFLFNPKTLRYHYDGRYWREIVERFSDSSETAAARQRLNDLKTKLETEK
jgi:hypothetical protein